MICCALHSDSNSSKGSFSSKKAMTCVAIIFSRTLERNGSLEIGLKLFSEFGSTEGFFRRG